LREQNGNARPCAARDEAIALSVLGNVAVERGEREAGTALMCESAALDTLRGRAS
jgi:hypothetical protein